MCISVCVCVRTHACMCGCVCGHVTLVVHMCSLVTSDSGVLAALIIALLFF